MRRALLSFLALALLPAAPARGEWKLSLPGWNYQFPRDHGSHPGFKTEWWYFTGNVRSNSGEDFGYQLTFFRQGVIPPGREVPASEFLPRDVKFAHFAVSELGRERFHHFQRLSRGSFAEAGFDDGNRIAWIRDWECIVTGDHAFRLRASEDGVSVDLTLVSTKPPVIHGKDGVSQKSEGAGRASHYYSLTRLETKGTITIEGRTFDVRGHSWFDHEWATNQLAAHQKGWDWFSLQFEDGTELMVFQIRTEDGGMDPYSSGTWVDAEGRGTKIPRSDFKLTPTAWWTSPKTKGRYPVAWKIEIPTRALALEVRARMDAQELAAEPFAYWEGAIRATGTRDGKSVTASGYLEMTGYAGRIVGLQDR